MTKIEWTHRPGTVGVTWNPITGCTPISEGCKNCYAKRMAQRLAGRFGYPEDDPFRVTLHEDKLEEPLQWRKDRTAFVASMGDLFHEDVKDEGVVDVFAVMALCNRHTFIILTKRADRMADTLTDEAFWNDVEYVALSNALRRFMILPYGVFSLGDHKLQVPPRNIWLGVTVENQQRADERIPLLLQCPATVRYVSYEPALGPVDFIRYFPYETDSGGFSPQGYPIDVAVPGLDWVIAGGETGSGARPADLDWFRSVRDQCVAADVPFFFKRGTLDGQEWHQWPQ